MQVVNEKIIHQINKGDSRAFEELYNAYYVYLCAVATKFVYVPEIVVVDTKEAYHKKRMEGHFSDVLLEKIAKALGNNEQIILFQNRRRI